MNEKPFIHMMRGHRGSVLYDGENTVYSFHDGLLYDNSIESCQVFPKNRDWVFGCLSYLNNDPCFLEGNGDIGAALWDYCGFYPEADPLEYWLSVEFCRHEFNDEGRYFKLEELSEAERLLFNEQYRSSVQHYASLRQDLMNHFFNDSNWIELDLKTFFDIASMPSADEVKDAFPNVYGCPAYKRYVTNIDNGVQGIASFPSDVTCAAKQAANSLHNVSDSCAEGFSSTLNR